MISMKFAQRKFSGLDGVTYMEFVMEGQMDKPLTLIASRAGVSIRGQIHLTSQEELQDFAEVVSDAWQAALTLTPKIMKDLPFPERLV